MAQGHSIGLPETPLGLHCSLKPSCTILFPYSYRCRIGTVVKGPSHLLPLHPFYPSHTFPLNTFIAPLIPSWHLLLGGSKLTQTKCKGLKQEHADMVTEYQEQHVRNRIREGSRDGECGQTQSRGLNPESPAGIIKT